MSEPFTHPLGLKLSEWRLILQCIGAYQMVSNGHFLPAPRWTKAARRLIARSYLTECDAKLSPPQPEWIVVKITRENIAKYNADLAAREAEA